MPATFFRPQPPGEADRTPATHPGLTPGGSGTYARSRVRGLGGQRPGGPAKERERELLSRVGRHRRRLRPPAAVERESSKKAPPPSSCRTVPGGRVARVQAQRSLARRAWRAGSPPGGGAAGQRERERERTRSLTLSARERGRSAQVLSLCPRPPPPPLKTQAPVHRPAPPPYDARSNAPVLMAGDGARREKLKGS